MSMDIFILSYKFIYLTMRSKKKENNFSVSNRKILLENLRN